MSALGKARSAGVATTRRTLLAGLGTALAGVATSAHAAARKALHDQVHATLLAGEPGPTSVLLQARMASALAVPGDFASDSPGLGGRIRFEIADNARFARPRRTAWLPAAAENDFIVQTAMDGLRPDSAYYYRAAFRDAMGRSHQPRTVGEFRTLPYPQSAKPLSFAVFSCLSYQQFYGLGKPSPYNQARGAPATEAERRRGYPAMDLIRQARPAFMVATGDTVYYDHPAHDTRFWTTTVSEMRRMWHLQLGLPSVKEAFGGVASYFMKDDHDFRIDDADNTGDKPPLPGDGRRVFLEQVPIASGGNPTYRTVRVNRHLQIWLLEGRDHRSPNAMPDGPDKSLWGKEQRAWLESTLLASDAAFKILLSPTPVIGPDDDRKNDNHTSQRGFQVEGEQFLAWLRDKGLVKSTFIVNGDRHWKYHSIHPTGVEELACGTIHRQNSRLGVAPGDPRGTDPKATIRQPYLQAKPDGGFLKIDIEPASTGKPAVMVARFLSEDGSVDYEVSRSAA